VPLNQFPGKSQAWLVERLDAIDAMLDGGAQTRVSLAPGMSDDFMGASPAELRRRKKEYLYSLSLIDPEVYGNPYDRPGVTQQSFC